ncbi:hypothetical protein [Methylobacterium sp.]|uniref:hypothetical protein n=1 Tax=Methylobacterium sp. TaxID=409 RepID=UPI00261DC751|nr:hypothetical protein [Methylobacterium sp.]
MKRVIARLIRHSALEPSIVPDQNVTPAPGNRKSVAHALLAPGKATGCMVRAPIDFHSDLLQRQMQGLNRVEARTEA